MSEMAVSQFNKKVFNAVSLVEVVVVLGIIATTLVSAAQLSVRMTRTIKDNEISDFTNGVVLQALEIAKSPAAVKLASAAGGGSSTGSYRLDRSGAQAVLWRESQTVNRITNCTSASPYRVQIADGSQQLLGEALVCLQILIQPRQGAVRQSYFEIEAISVYQLSDQIVVNSGLGYRREAFSQQ